MKKIVLAAALAAACSWQPVIADDGADDDSNSVVTFAVFGDWPYNDLLLQNANLLVDSVNADRKVQFVLHVGDIHSGSQPCTSAGILPPIPSSNPGWNQAVFQRFQQFEAPFVYTPGDNEWTDCHKAKEKGSGAPMSELAAVGGLFFSRPGVSLGLNEMDVATQALHFDSGFPSDGKFVENVMWRNGRTMFVTVNMPGSNNDTLPWSAPFTDNAAQGKEVVERTGAAMRWLDAAFAQAQRGGVRVLVIGLQADMWDPAALVAGGDGLSAYTPFVQHLAELANRFDGSVILFNGDSHLYEADHPLADRSSATGRIHGTPAVPNLTRITVQGSTNAPAEWLRVTIDARKKVPTVTWTNVAYCKDPLTSCQ